MNKKCEHSRRWWLAAGALLSAGIWAGPSLAAAEEDAALAAWRLLDYVAVDYREAVRDGQVINAEEYAEMREFGGAVEARLATLSGERQAQLHGSAVALREAIERREPPAVVAKLANALANDLLAAYPVPVSPRTAPDLAQAPALYAAHCATCHGATGHGDGPAAAGLEPPPVDFHDAGRQAQRSVFALYGIITHGVAGTAMGAYPALSDTQRWALAFHVGQMLYGPDERARGEQLWRASARAREVLPDLKAVVQTSPAQLAAVLGADEARALSAYLRAQPASAEPTGDDALSQARAALARSAERYAQGDTTGAVELALSAYLDGFEPVEPALAARNPGLMRAIETAMLDYRALLRPGGDAAQVREQAVQIDALLARAQAELRQPGVSGSALGAGFIILFREGLEALLVLVAIIAYLRKTGRTQALAYVHTGWIGALLLGVATWAAATWLISITGAQRELTEGVTGLIAVTVLLFVGLWMHSQSLSGRWQSYIRDRVQTHLDRNQLWGLTLLAFVAVYREVFETVLFYRALWGHGDHASLLAGAGAAALVLLAIGWALFRASARLPLQQYFRASSWLIVILAVVLAGKAAAAFQEAGLVGVTRWPVPAIGWLGVYPTAQTVIAQLGVLFLVLGGMLLNHRRSALPERGGDRSQP